jgi:isopenicillin N synthase-like dioxygenase
MMYVMHMYGGNIKLIGLQHKQNLVQSVIDYAPKLFDLPQETKESLAMVNNESFFGYNKLGAEITKGDIDFREQVNGFMNIWRKY